MLFVRDLKDWFIPVIDDVERISPDVRSYVIDVLAKDHHVITTSYVLEYSAALSKMNFESFQSLADDVMFSTIIHPERFKQNQELAHTIARLSYYRCHKILKCQWPLYEELADEFSTVTSEVRRAIEKHSSK